VASRVPASNNSLASTLERITPAVLAASSRPAAGAESENQRNPETLAVAKKALTDVVVLPSDSGDLAAALALGGEVEKYRDHLDGVFLNAGIAMPRAKAW
jgi:hypothetical protein